VHAARGSVAVLDGTSFEKPATKGAAEALRKWDARRPTLVILDREEGGAAMSFRNIPGVDVMSASDVGVADLVGHASLVVSQSALETLAARATDAGSGGNEGAGKAGSQSSEESAAEGKDSEE
jgi:large subunit ribosomal protein L4